MALLHPVLQVMKPEAVGLAGAARGAVGARAASQDVVTWRARQRVGAGRAVGGLVDVLAHQRRVVAAGPVRRGAVVGVARAQATTGHGRGLEFLIAVMCDLLVGVDLPGLRERHLRRQCAAGPGAGPQVRLAPTDASVRQISDGCAIRVYDPQS